MEATVFTDGSTIKRLAAKKRTKDPEWRAAIEKRSKNRRWRVAQKVAAKKRMRDPQMAGGPQRGNEADGPKTQLA